MTVPTARRTSAWIHATLAMVLVAGHGRTQSLSGSRPLFSEGEHPVEIGSVPHGLVDASATRCAVCHTDIAREWRSSQHATAWTESIFRVAFRREPLNLCRNCHAPLAGGTPDLVGGLVPALAEGVGCATCHVRDGVVLAARRDGSTVTAHATRTFTALETSAFCAGCHQFDFPRPTGIEDLHGIAREPMQDTFREWQRTTVADEPRCQECHMQWVTAPDGRRHRDHTFAGWSDPEMLRRAIDIEVSTQESDGATVVTATLAATAHVGHAVPTGDIFRQLELRVWTAGPGDHARTVTFGRTFGAVTEPTLSGRPVTLMRLHEDTRLPPPGTDEPRVVTIRLVGAGGAVTWRLDHLRMPVTMARTHGIPDAINRTPITQGTVVAPNPFRSTQAMGP